MTTVNIDVDREMARYQAAYRRLEAQRDLQQDISGWLQRGGGDPPECVRVRMLIHNLDADAYHRMYLHLRDRNAPEFWVETQALEDWSIRLVDPEWKR